MFYDDGYRVRSYRVVFDERPAQGCAYLEKKKIKITIGPTVFIKKKNAFYTVYGPSPADRREISRFDDIHVNE